MEILQSANDKLAIVLAESFLEDYKSQGERIGALKTENDKLDKKIDEQRKQIAWRDEHIKDYKAQIKKMEHNACEMMRELTESKEAIAKLNEEIMTLSKLPASQPVTATKQFQADSTAKKSCPASEPKASKAKRTKATDKFDPATAKVQYLPDVRGDEIPSRPPREIRFDTVERKLKSAGFERFDKGNDESVRKYKKDKNKNICVLMISELSRPQLVVDEVPCQGVDDAIERAGK